MCKGRRNNLSPPIDGDDERWAVLAAIDAVVADAYGLTREQYAHVLSTFSHRSYPRAPELCLERFDELKTIDLEAFTRNWDPYRDISLNENLPKPVIEIPGLEPEKTENGFTADRHGQISFLPPYFGPLLEHAKARKKAVSGSVPPHPSPLPRGEWRHRGSWGREVTPQPSPARGEGILGQEEGKTPCARHRRDL